MRLALGVLVTTVLSCALPARADTSATYDRAVEWLASQQHDNGGFAEMPGEGKGELGITCLVLCTAYCINAMNWALPYLER